jgi:hypothetical protein
MGDERIARTTSEQLAEALADYMATRIGGWPDEGAMREAVRETVRLIFTEARPETLKVLGVDALRSRLEFASGAVRKLSEEGEPWIAAASTAATYRDALAILEGDTDHG